MFGARSRDLGAEKVTRGEVGVDVTEAMIACHDPAAPLLFETHLSRDRGVTRGERGRAVADDRDVDGAVRLCRHDATR
jgi:hypothetical protein